MTATTGFAPYSVMVSWVSVNHRAQPLVRTLDGHFIKPRVTHLYLCWRDSNEGDNRERAALGETQRELRERLDPICPAIEVIPWKTDASPTAHNDLRPFAEEVLRRARKEHPEATIVIHLSPGTPAMHAIWLLLGTTGFIADPVELIQTSDKRPGVDRVRFRVDSWLRRFRRATPLRPAAEDGGQLWDPTRIKSPALREALAKIDAWAPLRAPILLLGERGTGKTTIANLIRARSTTKRSPTDAWPVVVCGQFRVSPQLARSELFGHVKGAFTGADGDHPGLLEAADGDALFLDEIADIDRDTQRLLIAAVEGRGFSRLGESKIRHSHFHLIAATNRDLADLRGELLDLDFLDRIAIFTLRVPALRECQEDLPDAWRSTLRRAAGATGVAVDVERFGHAEALLGPLQVHPLPGNFRDLQRVAYHLLAAANAGKGDSDAIAAALASLGPAPRPTAASLPSIEELDASLPLDSLDTHLNNLQRRWIEAAMRRADGVQSSAAELLGMKRKTFEDRRRKLLGEEPPAPAGSRRRA